MHPKKEISSQNSALRNWEISRNAAANKMDRNHMADKQIKPKDKKDNGKNIQYSYLYCIFPKNIFRSGVFSENLKTIKNPF